MTEERNLLNPAEYFARYAELYEQYKFQEAAYLALEKEFESRYGCRKFLSLKTFQDSLYSRSRRKIGRLKVVIWFRPHENTV
jgi:hypothetical protein